MDAAAPVHRRPRGGDLLQHDGRLGDPLTAAAVRLGNGDPDPAAVGHGVVELPRELVVTVHLAPVGVVELLAHPADGFTDLFVIGVDSELHQVTTFTVGNLPMNTSSESVSSTA